MKNRPITQQIYEASCAVIPGGVNSPVRSFPGMELTPIVAVSGKDDLVFDADGHSYIDFCCSWGALILGHAHPLVSQAACSQIIAGSSFGMATPFEYELASRVCTLMPSIEKIRFVSSGTEAVMSAVRLARGYSGKSLIVKFDGHYHGHADHFLVRAGSGTLHLNADASSKGVPKELVSQTISLPFNDTAAFLELLHTQKEIAAVVLEPIAANMGLVLPDPDFLKTIRTETEKRGILLIFDEVVTGFRAALGGAQALYGITPDLTCLGKIVGGGFPAAAFGGKKEIMDHLAPLGEVYQAGTLSGNPVAMQAGLTTLNEISKPGFYGELEKKTQLITEPLKALIRECDLNACVTQVGSLFTLFLGVRSVSSRTVLDVDLYRQLFTHLFERGIYFPPSPYEACFVSSAHTLEHLEKTRDVILGFFLG